MADLAWHGHDVADANVMHHDASRIWSHTLSSSFSLPSISFLFLSILSILSCSDWSDWSSAFAAWMHWMLLMLASLFSEFTEFSVSGFTGLAKLTQFEKLQTWWLQFKLTRSDQFLSAVHWPCQAWLTHLQVQCRFNGLTRSSHSQKHPKTVLRMYHYH